MKDSRRAGKASSGNGVNNAGSNDDQPTSTPYQHNRKITFHDMIAAYDSVHPILTPNDVHRGLLQLGFVLPDVDGVQGVKHWIRQAGLEEPIYPMSFEAFTALKRHLDGVKRGSVMSARTDAEGFMISFGDEVGSDVVSRTCDTFALHPDFDGVAAKPNITCREFLSWAAQEAPGSGLTKEQSLRARKNWSHVLQVVTARIRRDQRMQRLIKKGKQVATAAGERQTLNLHNTDELQVTRDGILASHNDKLKAVTMRGGKVLDFVPPNSVREVGSKPRKVTTEQALMRMSFGPNGDSVSCKLARKLRDMMHRTRTTVQKEVMRRHSTTRRPKRLPFQISSDDSDDEAYAAKVSPEPENGLNMDDTELASFLTPSKKGRSGLASTASPRALRMMMSAEEQDQRQAQEVALSLREAPPPSPELEYWIHGGVEFNAGKWYERATTRPPISMQVIADLRTLRQQLATPPAERILKVHAAQGANRRSPEHEEIVAKISDRMTPLPRPSSSLGELYALPPRKMPQPSTLGRALKREEDAQNKNKVKRNITITAGARSSGQRPVSASASRTSERSESTSRR
eukprot:PhM_4_TR1201/c0_g1_i1/m.20733